MDNINLSVEQLARVFEEWGRRYREAPDEFVDLATHLLYSNPQTYGEEASNYFYSLLQEMKLQGEIMDKGERK